MVMSPAKESLISGRVAKRMRALAIGNNEQYLEHIERDTSGREIIYLLDAISTNVTSFFRESDHFDLLRELLRSWHQEGQRRFRIWSAACSSGEEPYSLAMTVREVLPAGIDIKLLASDISTDILAQAQLAEYDEPKVETIPKLLRIKYMSRFRKNGGVYYRMDEVTRALVLFKRINLAKPPYPMRGPFDVIFCRNVMIYFDNDIRQGFLDEAYRLLKPGGYLMVGHSESLTGMKTKFQSVKPSVYVKR